MTDTEARIRAATQAAGRVVRELRPLDLSAGRPAAPIPRRRVRGSAARRLRSWAVPLSAAAAILAIALALVAVRGLPGGRPGTAHPGPSPTGAVSGTAVPGGLPPYYVALADPQDSKSPDQVIVGDTTTGSRLATVSPPAGGTFGGVTGAAGDRTFILDVRQFPWSSTYPQVTPRVFYLLRIAPGTARLTTLTKLSIPATPNGAQVNGIALSPDGTEFAVMFQPGAWGPTPGPMTLQIYSVATGKLLHAWAGPTPNPSGGGVQTFGEYLYQDPNTTLSWTADGRSLAFVYGPQIIADTTVRILDVADSGRALLADSRLVLDLKSGAVPDCSSLLLTPDGRTVVCGAGLPSGSGSTAGCSAVSGLARPGIVEYSTATGKLARVIYQYAGSCVRGAAGALWSNPTGSTVFGSLDITRYETGEFADGKFLPLALPVANGARTASGIAW